MESSKNSEYTFSQRATALTSSAIREILKITARPDVISFAGGLPSPQGFPTDKLHKAFDYVLKNNSQVALQYGPTEGYQPLREWVAKDLSTDDVEISPNQILIVSGSQQALDMLGKLFIDTDSKVLIEAPSYLGAIQSFDQYQPKYIGVPSDDKGLNPEGLTDDVVEGARFIYVLPNFQNPTGLTLGLDRREELVKRCAQAKLPIIEDDPYGELRYAGSSQPSLLHLGSKAGATVIRLGSFSKVLAPGLRIGYVVAPEAVISKLAQIKQATDLHTASLTQMAVYEAVKDGFLTDHLPIVQDLYQKQCDYMLDAMEKDFPKTATWTKPEGGMFIWVTLPQHIDSTKLLEKAVEKGVAFVPGAPFYAGCQPLSNTLRLSFVTVSEAKIRQGISVLAELIKNYQD